VDWIPGGTPELAVLTASGLVVLTAQGSKLTAWPQSLTAGRLAAVPRAPAGEDVLSVVQLASWQLVRHTPAGATPCGVLPIAPSALVPGLATGLLDGDEHPDLLVSTDGIMRVVVLAPNGTFVPAQAVL